MFLRLAQLGSLRVSDRHVPITQLCGALQASNDNLVRGASETTTSPLQSCGPAIECGQLWSEQRGALVGGAVRRRQRAHYGAMHQYDRRIALEHRVVTLAEATRCIASSEELARFDQQNLGLRSNLVGCHRRTRRRRATPVTGVADQLVDADDQLLDRMQPRKS